MKYWSGYLQNLCFRFLILATSGQVNFDPIYYEPRGNYFLPITFEPMVIDEWNGCQSACIVAPNWMIPNVTNFDLIWAVTHHWAGDRVFFVGAKMGITRLLLTRKPRWCQTRCCRTNSSEVIVEKCKIWKIVFDLSRYILTPSTKTVDLRSNLRTYSR